jgi:hypothetical protein
VQGLSKKHPPASFLYFIFYFSIFFFRRFLASGVQKQPPKSKPMPCRKRLTFYKKTRGNSMSLSPFPRKFLLRFWTFRTFVFYPHQASGVQKHLRPPTSKNCRGGEMPEIPHPTHTPAWAFFLFSAPCAFCALSLVTSHKVLCLECLVLSACACALALRLFIVYFLGVGRPLARQQRKAATKTAFSTKRQFSAAWCLRIPGAHYEMLLRMNTTSWPAIFTWSKSL